MSSPLFSCAAVWDGLLRLGAGMSAAVALAGGIAAAVFPALDALNHGAPFAFLASIGVLGAAAWTWRRQPTQRAGSLAAAGGAALMLGLTVAPEAVAGLFTRREPPREAGPTITVATLNLWQGGRWEGQAVDYLIETNADFIVLQETGFLYRPGLLRLREAYPFAIESIAAPYAQVTLLSRRPPVAANAVAGAAWSLAAQGQPPRRLRWTEAVFAAHGRPVHLVGLHARRNGGVAATAAELDAISRTLATADDRSALIVAGDFNTTPWTHSLRRFGRAAGLRRATRQIATYPSPARGNPDWPPFAIFPIDHQFSGSGWRPVAVRRGPDVGSDHYPVIVTYQATP